MLCRTAQINIMLNKAGLDNPALFVLSCLHKTQKGSEVDGMGKVNAPAIAGTIAGADPRASAQQAIKGTLLL